MEKEVIREAILDAMSESLEAQLRAVRRLRGGDEAKERGERSMSQADMAYDILMRARKPLHVTEIIDRIEKVHGARLDRESLVSALSKRVAREDRFVRTDRNTFAVRGEGL
jgi:hypothetical protein